MKIMDGILAIWIWVEDMVEVWNTWKRITAGSARTLKLIKFSIF
jgi:hypothetical protein